MEYVYVPMEYVYVPYEEPTGYVRFDYGEKLNIWRNPTEDMPEDFTIQRTG